MSSENSGISLDAQTNHGNPREPPPEPPDRSRPSEREDGHAAKRGRIGEEGKQMDYRNSLMNGTAMEVSMTDMVHSIQVTVEKEDIMVVTTGEVPQVTTSVSLRERLVQNFKYAVIVNLLGRSIGYKALCTKLSAMWSMNGAKVLDLGNQYFLVQFSTEIAYLEALLEGPWMVMGSYLQVQPWSSSFRVSHATPRTATVWCRLPEFSLLFYSPDVVRAIGQAVGTVVKVDDNTSELQRGKFARLAVSVDLDKPLVSQFYLDGQLQRVEYENMEELCYYCCRFGHREAYCQWKPKDTTTTGASADQVVVHEPTGGSYSPWIVVEKRRRPPKRVTESKDNENPNASNGAQSDVMCCHMIYHD